jgi:hypothetical protein
VRCFVGQISRTAFLTRDPPASIPDVPVLGRQASHLLLIRTNLGYGTVIITAAWAVRTVVPLIIIIIIIIVIIIIIIIIITVFWVLAPCGLLEVHRSFKRCVTAIINHKS